MSTALLKAIEGYKGETSGSKAHENIHALLSRVVDEIHKGSAPVHDTPGRREASSAAGQREMPAERPNDAGDGQRESNRPGSAGPPVPAPDIHGSSGPSDRLSGAAPVRSRGNRVSNETGPGFSGKEGDIRRLAANRERSRPDTKFAHTSTDNRAGGNTDSVAPAPAARADTAGNAKAPSANSRGSNPRVSTEQPEGKPAYAQQEMRREQARKILGRK